MYLFKPSEQAQSDPIDFYFRPNKDMVDIAQQPAKAAQKRTKVKNIDEDQSSSKFFLKISKQW